MTAETATRPASFLVQLESILDPLRLEMLFPMRQPLEVELGAGDGSFITQYARLHPERNFLAVERLLGRLRKVDRKARRTGLANVRAVHIESSYFLQYLLPPAAAAALHIYFPDPWPKRKQQRRRLVNARFPALARRALEPRGLVYLRTDSAGYHEQMREVFQAAPFFREIEAPNELAEVLTDFEREFHAAGIPTLRAAYQRVS